MCETIVFDGGADSDTNQDGDNSSESGIDFDETHAAAFGPDDNLLTIARPFGSPGPSLPTIPPPHIDTESAWGDDMPDAALASPSSSPLSSLSEQSSSEDDIPLAVRVKQNAKSKAKAATAKATAKEAPGTEPTTTKGGTTKKVSSKGAPKNTATRKSKAADAPSKDSTAKGSTTRSGKGKAKAVPVTRKKLRFADVDEVF